MTKIEINKNKIFLPSPLRIESSVVSTPGPAYLSALVAAAIFYSLIPQLTHSFPDLLTHSPT